MDLISSQDLKKVFKTIFLVLVVYSVANHTVRLSARAFGRGGGWSDFVLGATFQSLDSFRRRCGDWVQGASDICPEDSQYYCSEFVKAVRMLLGLQR